MSRVRRLAGSLALHHPLRRPELARAAAEPNRAGYEEATDRIHAWRSGQFFVPLC